MKFDDFFVVAIWSSWLWSCNALKIWRKKQNLATTQNCVPFIRSVKIIKFSEIMLHPVRSWPYRRRAGIEMSKTKMMSLFCAKFRLTVSDSCVSQAWVMFFIRVSLCSKTILDICIQAFVACVGNRFGRNQLQSLLKTNW